MKRKYHILIFIIFLLTSCSLTNINRTKKGLKQGVWIENDINSIIKITKYKKGKITGKRIYIYPNGRKTIYYYHNGQQLLKATEIDTNGNKKTWILFPSF